MGQWILADFELYLQTDAGSEEREVMHAILVMQVQELAALSVGLDAPEDGVSVITVSAEEGA